MSKHQKLLKNYREGKKRAGFEFKIHTAHNLSQGIKPAFLAEKELNGSNAKVFKSLAASLVVALIGLLPKKWNFVIVALAWLAGLLLIGTAHERRDQYGTFPPDWTDEEEAGFQASLPYVPDDVNPNEVPDGWTEEEEEGFQRDRDNW